MPLGWRLATLAQPLGTQRVVSWGAGEVFVTKKTAKTKEFKTLAPKQLKSLVKPSRFCSLCPALLGVSDLFSLLLGTGSYQ